MVRFLVFSLLAGFFIAAEYGLTRPVSHSLFLSIFSSGSFPLAWLAAIPLNALVVSLYNRFLGQVGPLRMFLCFAIAIPVINGILAFFLPIYPDLIFYHFLWKDVYILFMFKQLWSMLHTTIAASRAKYLYGLFFAAGSLGGLSGNLIPALFAVKTGSEILLFGTIPIYACVILFYWLAYRRSAVPEQSFAGIGKNSFTEAWKLTFSSLFLRCLFFLVLFMQISSSLFEYQFNWHLERAFLDKDITSAYLGRLMAIVNFSTILIQILGSFLLVRFFGLKGAHLFVPFFLSLNILFSGIWSSLAVASFAFITVKSIDYSLFSVLRELLYPSLSLEEKFHAKSVIDVFAHRASKSLASLIILALQFSAGAYLLTLLQISQILICCAWVGVVFMMFRQYNPVTAR